MALDGGMDAAPRFQNITAWFNTEETVSHPADMDADAVLLCFWSYACPDSHQELPRIQELWEHYRDHGLAVVGVHTPTFSFEQDQDNVETAVKERDIPYPVVLDAENTTWKLYGNRHRPRQTVVDGDGHIRHERTGNGFQDMEGAVRRLLLHAGNSLPDPLFSDDHGQRPDSGQDEEQDADAAATAMVSPQVCAGENGPDLGNAAYQVCHAYTPIDYTDQHPDEHRMNQLYLDGTWMQDDERVTFQGDTGHAALRFTAQSCTVTLAPGDAEEARVDVELDGEPVPRDLRGPDVHEDDRGTYVTVTWPRLYRIVEQDTVDVREIRLVPRDTGLHVYAFSFS